jgi:hypothetical protein
MGEEKIKTQGALTHENKSVVRIQNCNMAMSTNQWIPFEERYRSASSAAMQPEPAAVTAWR